MAARHPSNNRSARCHIPTYMDQMRAPDLDARHGAILMFALLPSCILTLSFLLLDFSLLQLLAVHNADAINVPNLSGVF